MGKDLERVVRELCEQGRASDAAREALEAYGPELNGFIVRLARDDTLAEDAYAQLAEDVWRGIEKFEWRCSLRVWLYKLARHALFRTREARDRGGARVPLSRVPEPLAVPRSTTRPYLRSDVKSRFRALVDELDEDDRTLLVLRLDRNLSWLELAEVVGRTDGDKNTLDREAARLRKRFSRLKEMLRARSVDAGIVPSD